MKAGEIYNKVAASYRLAYHKLRGKISSVTDTVVDLDFSILKLIFVVILIILSALIVCFIIILTWERRGTAGSPLPRRHQPTGGG